VQNQTQPETFIICSEALREGFEGGMQGNFRSFHPTGTPTEDELVSTIVNLTEIAQEGWLTEELVRSDVGFIAGWLTRYVKDSRPVQ